MYFGPKWASLMVGWQVKSYQQSKSPENLKLTPCTKEFLSYPYKGALRRHYRTLKIATAMGNGKHMRDDGRRCSILCLKILLLRFLPPKTAAPAVESHSCAIVCCKLGVFSRIVKGFESLDDVKVQTQLFGMLLCNEIVSKD